MDNKWRIVVIDLALLSMSYIDIILIELRQPLVTKENAIFDGTPYKIDIVSHIGSRCARDHSVDRNDARSY